MANSHPTTQQRLQQIRQLGYDVVTVWECEWEPMKNTDSRIAEFVQHHDVIAPIEPHDAFFGGPINAAHLYY